MKINYAQTSSTVHHMQRKRGRGERPGLGPHPQMVTAPQRRGNGERNANATDGPENEGPRRRQAKEGGGEGGDA